MKNKDLNKRDSLNKNMKILTFLLLGMFMISFASAWTSSEFTLDEIKSVDTTTKYGTYEIIESSWYDPLQIWTDEVVKSFDTVVLPINVLVLPLNNKL